MYPNIKFNEFYLFRVLEKKRLFIFHLSKELDSSMILGNNSVKPWSN